MQPNWDFLPPYVHPITVSVSGRAQPPPLPGSLPLVRRMSVTREGFRAPRCTLTLKLSSAHYGVRMCQSETSKEGKYKIITALQLKPAELLSSCIMVVFPLVPTCTRHYGVAVCTCYERTGMCTTYRVQAPIAYALSPTYMQPCSIVSALVCNVTNKAGSC